MTNYRVPTDVLDDLSSRFLANLPQEEQADNVRICFQLEQAHWFYTDYYAADNEKYDDCPPIGVRQFFKFDFTWLCAEQLIPDSC